MFISRYKYQGREDRWDFDEIEFSSVNLFVGDSATGKTRLFNTIFNLGSFAVSDKFFTGYWKIEFSHNKTTFRWELEAQKIEGKNRILIEKLWRIELDDEVLLVDRSPEHFTYQGNRNLPRLSTTTTSISLLKEEQDISSAYEGFYSILRRRFHLDAPKSVTELTSIPRHIVEKIQFSKSLRDLYEADITLNAKLYLLDHCFNEIYTQIIQHYKAIFPFVQEAVIRNLNDIATNVASTSDVPVFCIRERGGDSLIPVTELSSGMQKVLLLLTDILSLPNGGLYMVDEYENSLGIGAINFLPELIFSRENENQFLITSHHPYLINEIPPKNWLVFHREANKVSIKFGKELEERFSRSSQQAFIQLINDPFYASGIE